MLANFSQRLTYFGVLDDVVDRYPWPAKVDETSLQQQLITAAIYNKKVLINDGYLVANPILLGELTDIDTTLVGNMLMTGVARIFSRASTGNLAEGIENNAAKIETHRKLVEDRGLWRFMRDDLEYLSDQLDGFTITWPRDKNMGQIFHVLLTRVRAFQQQDRLRIMSAADFREFDAIYARYEHEIDHKSFDAARTIFEKQCWQHAAGRDVTTDEITNTRSFDARRARFSGYELVCRMMNIANELYHLAYSMGAYHSVVSGAPSKGLDTSEMGVASALVTAFPDLINEEDAGTHVAVPEERLRDLNQILVTVPRGLKYKGDFAFVTRFSTNGNCRRGREHYLEEITRYIHGGGSLVHARQASEEYKAAIAGIMAPYVAETWTEKLITSPLSAFGFEELDVTEWAVAQLGPVGKLLSIGMDYFGNKLVERLVKQRVQVGLGEEGLEAHQRAGAVPLARRLGLYVGPIDTAGGARVLEGIDPHPAVTAA
ncbi:hypothetical protein [Kordiimonas sp.]|uniref:hypothetical protein n=1 Tax=Kordiimonas sp. TaxID=1970157 RepID=UPI003A9061D2